MITDVQRDICDTEKRMDRLREAYLVKLLRGETTRAQTTSYNARMGQFDERLQELRTILNHTSQKGT